MTGKWDGAMRGLSGADDVVTSVCPECSYEDRRGGKHGPLCSRGRTHWQQWAQQALDEMERRTTLGESIGDAHAALLDAHMVLTDIAARGHEPYWSVKAFVLRHGLQGEVV